MRTAHLGEAARLAPCDELARALCVTSHHGLTRTAWPCDYHRRRAAEAWGEIVRARRSESEEEKWSRYRRS
jgi:hypothetical protein